MTAALRSSASTRGARAATGAGRGRRARPGARAGASGLPPGRWRLRRKRWWGTLTASTDGAEDAGHGEALTSAATAPVERPPLSGACREVPAEHGGQGVEFSFGREFSENFPGRLPQPEAEEEALSAVDGAVTGARVAEGGRTSAGSSRCGRERRRM